MSVLLSVIDIITFRWPAFDTNYHDGLLIPCAAYNKWHETELERWLSDHNVPYPTPADRKDLENLVKSNWQSKVSSPYADWEPSQLQSYIKAKGHDVKKGTESNKNSLVSQVKSYWHESADTASDSYKSVKDWVFDGSSTAFVERRSNLLTWNTQLDRLSTQGIPR